MKIREQTFQVPAPFRLANKYGLDPFTIIVNNESIHWRAAVLSDVSSTLFCCDRPPEQVCQQSTGHQFSFPLATVILLVCVYRSMEYNIFVFVFLMFDKFELFYFEGVIHLFTHLFFMRFH